MPGSVLVETRKEPEPFITAKCHPSAFLERNSQIVVAVRGERVCY